MLRHFPAPRFALAFFVLIVAALSYAHAQDTVVKLADCPEPVQKTFALEAKPTKIDSVNKSVDAEGVTTFWVKTTIANRFFEIHVDDEGTLISMELDVKEDEVKYADCPAAVKATLAKESNNGKFEEVGKGVKYGITVYDAVAQVGGKEYSFVVAENGTLVEKMLVVIEDEVELAATPAAVQRWIKEHTTGAKILHIMQSTGLISRVFEIDLEVSGKTYIVEITEGGNLISKTLLDDGDVPEMDEKAPPKPAAKKEDQPAAKK